MYKKQDKTLKAIIGTIIVSLFIWIWNNIFASELISDISTIFSKYYNWIDESYLNAPYSSTYSKDPFRDNLDNFDNMIMSTKVAWVKYVEEALAEEGCSLKNKEIRWILYYYSDDFRWEIAMKLKSDWFLAKNIVIEEEDIQEYCTTYFNCMRKDHSSKDITSSTAEDILTNCKEFFVSNYNEWRLQSERFQDIETSELWADKYRNAITDDSPYDIMSDIETIWMLLYKETEKVVTPVLYHLPMFSNSEQSMLKTIWSSNKWTSTTNNSSNWSSSTSRTTNWSDSSTIDLWSWTPSTTNDNPNNNQWSVDWSNQSPTSNWWSSNDPFYNVFDDEAIDFLVDGLWWSRLSSSLFNWSSCEDPTLPSNEPEATKSITAKSVNDFKDNLDDFTDEEYEEFVEAMKDAINPYTKMDDEKAAKIEQKASEWNAKGNAQTNAQWIEEAAETIKDCRESCEWLRIDQQASCMLMCACWETTSKLFDPEKFPWLWPIFKVRYCTVPGVNSNFSVWWTKIISIEEWINEINWVVEKLSREWKLWTRTQQYNFLDSSTKNMNFADTFAFSIDVELVDIWKNHHKSTQSQEIQAKIQNGLVKAAFKTDTALDNVNLKNMFRLVSNGNETVSDIKWYKTELDNSTNQILNVANTDMAQRHLGFSSLIDAWLSQQANLWISATEYARIRFDDADLLYKKPKG